MKRLIIIDLSNFIFRAFYAIRPLTAPNGTPVNAVYGVLSMLNNMIAKYQPTHILVARDTKEGSFRKEIYPEYKANRTEPPDDLIPQFALVDQLIHSLELPEIRMQSYEADDIIGSVAVQWGKEFDEVLIASGDKDLMQFVNDRIHMLDTMKEKIYTREDVKDKMGVYPEQIVDYLALIGDSSDNIPGVPGIGPKGAQGLLEEYGDLATILENVEKVKNKRCQTALKEHPDKAIISKKLAEIVTNLDLKLQPEGLSYKLKLTSQLEDFLNEVGFRTWLDKLAPYKVGSPVVEKMKSATRTVQKWSVNDLDSYISGEPRVALTHICEDELDQQRCWQGLAIATSKATGYISISADEVTKLTIILNKSGAEVVCYQTKPLLQLAFTSGVMPTFNYFDLAQAHFNINPEMRHDLSTMSEEYLGHKVSPSKKGQRDLLGSVDDEEIAIVGERAEAILALYSHLNQKLKEMKVERPYNELDIPLIKVLAEMELNGIRLNVPFYHELEKDFSQQLAQIEAEVFELAGDKINLRSPKQVGEFLFEKLQLPVIKKTKTGYSTDADVLSELAAMNVSPIPEMLLKYREIEKLLSTYVKALPLMVDRRSKKIHTHFQPSNAATGRLSSDHPNLQNIPVRTENGRKLRRGFIASEGRTLLSADYSQVELRLLAHFSQDPNMLEAFNKELDIHRQTAAEVFDVPLEQVSKGERNSAKAINFGLMYGQTSFGLSQALKISQADAKKYITSYFRKFHAVKGYLDGLKEKAEETGYAETLFGRKRTLPNINSTNRQVKAMAERMAINSPIQGTAADIIKLAMINIQKELQDKNFKSRMILQVHDELIFDVVPEELEAMKVLVRDKMENAVDLTVSLKVELGVGENWYDLK